MLTDFINVTPADEKPWNRNSEANMLRMNDVVNIVSKLNKFWPLSVRQVYYRVISMEGFRDKCYWLSQKGPTKGQPMADYYDTIGEILKWARLGNDNRLPMYAINDEGREVGLKTGFSSTSQFFRQSTDELFKGYSACLAENQPRYIEVWVEKRGLFHIVEPIADEFCRRTFSTRGYPSVTALADYADRVSGADDPLILYFGDLDADGIEIPRTILSSLYYEHDVDVEIVRCGLNPAQTTSLKASPISIKGSPKQKRDFIRNYGSQAFELEAIDPGDLQHLVRESLEECTDMAVLAEDKKAGRRDAGKFDKLAGDVIQYAEKKAAAAGLIIQE